VVAVRWIIFQKKSRLENGKEWTSKPILKGHNAIGKQIRKRGKACPYKLLCEEQQSRTSLTHNPMPTALRCAEDHSLNS
jgi:hypothetical protein